MKVDRPSPQPAGLVPRVIEEYAADHSTPPSALVEELERYTAETCSAPQMMIGRLEGALLGVLIRFGRVRRILELGTFTGYSTLTMAEALPEDGTIDTCELDERSAAIARSFFERSPHGRKITVHLGPAAETISRLASRPPYDLALLDADKDRYPAYYEAVLPLLRPGGLLIVDNVLFSGTVLLPRTDGHRAVAQLNCTASTDPRVEQVILPIRDGVSLIYKRAVDEQDGRPQSIEASVPCSDPSPGD